jgi:AcrR family transcriptional regulator
MSPRPDVSEERRNQIIESAINVFAREGFANTRMEDVAAESGLSKGLLYWYFKSKEDIIIAIADLLFSAEFRKMQNLSIEGQTSRDCLEKFLDIFVKDLQTIIKLSPVIYEFYALAFRNKAVRHVMHEYFQRFMMIMEPIILHGMEQGEFMSGSARQVTIAIGASFEGTLLLWSYAPDIIRPEQQLRANLDIIVRGLECR